MPPEVNRNARRTDPATSYQRIPHTQAQRLLAVFADFPEGLTADQAAAAADLLHTGYWKRVSDLTRDGLIEPTGRTWVGRSGCRQRVLRVTDAGVRSARSLP